MPPSVRGGGDWRSAALPSHAADAVDAARDARGTRQLAEACRRFEGRIALMRDPDLIVRAQQAASSLETAWRRWRSMHGLTGEPPPAVSSYVGYSLDAPWGQPRIVFGICAEEAEQLAILLAQHDCVGPVHAAAKKSTGTAPDQAPAPEPARPEADHPTVVTQPVVAQPVLAAPPGPAAFLHVPAPAPASAGQQPLPASATARSSARSALT